DPVPPAHSAPWPNSRVVASSSRSRRPPRPTSHRRRGSGPSRGGSMLYLSQAIGRPVRDRQGKPIGQVADLIVAVGDRYPPVTGLVVQTGRRRIFLPWSSVETLDDKIGIAHV